MALFTEFLSSRESPMPETDFFDELISVIGEAEALAKAA
jgi:hypothetical protein